MWSASDSDSSEDWPDTEDDAPDDDGYIPCPHCGETMLEDAEHCPYCDRWVSTEDFARQRKPWWIVAAAIALLAVMILSILR